MFGNLWMVLIGIIGGLFVVGVIILISPLLLAVLISVAVVAAIMVAIALGRATTTGTSRNEAPRSTSPPGGAGERPRPSGRPASGEGAE